MHVCVSLRNVYYIISADAVWIMAVVDSENKATSNAAHYAVLIITDICPVCRQYRLRFLDPRDEIQPLAAS